MFILEYLILMYLYDLITLLSKPPTVNFETNVLAFCIFQHVKVWEKHDEFDQIIISDFFGI